MRIITHNGKMHADEVFATAFLMLVAENRYEDAEIVRAKYVPDKKIGDIVIDMGGGRYDHHHGSVEIRSNSPVPYASFGLIVRDFGPALMSAQDSNEFDKRYCQPIDWQDNGGPKNPLSNAISTFNTSWDSDESQDDAFIEAVEFAKSLIERQLKLFASRRKAKVVVEKAADEAEKGIAVLPCYAPWQQFLIPRDDINYVIFPSDRGGYNLQTVQRNFGMEAKGPLPEGWLTADPDGCTFVHQKLFLAVFNTVEQAVAAATRIGE